MITIPDELIDEIINYIKGCVLIEECEWGEARDVEKVITSGEMPNVYYKIIKYINNGNK